MFKSPFGGSRKRGQSELNNERGLSNLFANLAKALAFVAVVAVAMMVTQKPADPRTKVFEVTTLWDLNLDEARDGRRPGHSFADVDTWVAYVPDNGDPDVVGYSNRRTELWALNQDDTGWSGADRNNDNREEIIVSRRSRLPPGQYIVNVHLYSPRNEQPSAERPIRVRVRVVINEGVEGLTRKTLERTVDLTQHGQERTAFTFQIDANGQFVPGSQDNVVDMPIATGNLRSFNRGSAN
jgi:hypothetical protein